MTGLEPVTYAPLTRIKQQETTEESRTLPGLFGSWWTPQWTPCLQDVHWGALFQPARGTYRAGGLGRLGRLGRRARMLSVPFRRPPPSFERRSCTEPDRASGHSSSSTENGRPR